MSPPYIYSLSLHDALPIYRACVFLPTVIPEVAYALIWLWIFNPLYGPLNVGLGALGLPRLAWLVDPDTALPAIVIMSLFQIGRAHVVLQSRFGLVCRLLLE